MLTVLGLAAVMGVGVAGAQEIDTVIPAPSGTRLHVSAMGGEVSVRAWNRGEVRVIADLKERDRLEISRTGSVIRVRPRSRYGVPRSVDLRVTVPAEMGIQVGGTNVDVDVRGVRGSVEVQTVQGDVVLEGGDRFVTVRSVHGDVVVRGARGRVRAETVNGEIRVGNVVGELAAETVNGDVFLEGVDADVVDAVTVNGEILYDGTIRDGGRYMFNTHNGDVIVFVPETANVTVSVSTFNGDFEPEFPVTIMGTRDKRITFTLGDGSARLQLESFGGSIVLRRPRGGGPGRR